MYKVYNKVINKWLDGSKANSGKTINGTVRLKGELNTLYSFEHYILCTKIGQIYLINADTGPTKTTNRQLNVLLRCLEKRELKVAYCPRSALHAAGIYTTIEPVDYTSAKLVKRINGKGIEYEEHFLGELVFKHLNRYYVCGLDRNEPLKRRSFFLARLPKKIKPKTVDEALIGLCPFPQTDWVRQGEWFFEPSPFKFKAHFKKVPILDEAPSQQEKLKQNNTRRNRHVVSEMCYVGNNIYVKGVVRDRQHNTLKLNKNVWYLVRKNLADGSWGALGQVD